MGQSRKVVYLFWRYSIYFLCRTKRSAGAVNGSGNMYSKKGRGGGNPHHLVNRAFEGLGYGGRSGGRGRGRGRGPRGRGRGYR